MNEQADTQKKKDIFYTPHDVISQIMKLVFRRDEFLHTPIVTPAYDRVMNILDPSCGDGRMLFSLVSQCPMWTHRSSVISVDKYYDGQSLKLPFNQTLKHYKMDFLSDEFQPEERFDLIVTNPPYSLATEFIEKCWRLMNFHGQMWFLLRLDFLGSKDRYERIYTKIPPTDVWVLSKRPSFTGGGTDQHNYGWFRWVKGFHQGTQVYWLPPA